MLSDLSASWYAVRPPTVGTRAHGGWCAQHSSGSIFGATRWTICGYTRLPRPSHIAPRDVACCPRHTERGSWLFHRRARALHRPNPHHGIAQPTRERWCGSAGAEPPSSRITGDTEATVLDGAVGAPTQSRSTRSNRVYHRWSSQQAVQGGAQRTQHPARDGTHVRPVTMVGDAGRVEGVCRSRDDWDARAVGRWGFDARAYRCPDDDDVRSEKVES